MAVTVRELFECVYANEIKLMAGEKGLNRTVYWVHMVEAPEISTFLNGGELVFTTGVALSKESSLYEHVKIIIANGASGIVVNIGPYIDKIDKQVIDLCNQKNVPFFSVPWHVHMAEIMRDVCFKISLEDKKQVERYAAVKNAILFPAQTELYVHHLEGYGLKANSCYTALVLDYEPGEGKDSLYKRILVRRLEDCINQNNWHCQAFDMDDYVLMLFVGNDYTEEKLIACNRLVLNEFSNLGFTDIKSGIGRMVGSVYDLYKTCNEARRVVDLKKYNVNTTIFYNHLGIYKLLLAIEDRELIKKYVEDTIGNIINYDKMNNSNLVDVLKIYLKYNGSVKKTAEELFMHRNTVNYKIRRIGELLNCSLVDYEKCSELSIALKLYEILKGVI